MITKLVYAHFCELSENGVAYSVYDEHMREYMDDHSPKKFLCEVELPEIDKDEVTGMAVAAIDKEIIDLQVAITRKEEKKKQLLAIEYKG